jgi:hypothetical protein
MTDGFLDQRDTGLVCALKNAKMSGMPVLSRTDTCRNSPNSLTGLLS